MPFLPDMLGMFQKLPGTFRIFLKFYVKMQGFYWHTQCLQMAHKSMKCPHPHPTQ